MSLSPPSLNALRVFEAAARLESFARAAEVLDLTTSAVSQQIKSLERELGTPLFVRGPRSVKLNEAGQAYLPTVRQSLNNIQETTETLFGAKRENSLSLQIDMLFGTAWLAPRLNFFSQKHPDIRLLLNSAFRDNDYQKPGAELRVLFGPVHRSWGQCDRLTQEQVYPVALPEIANQIKTVDTLLKHRLIQIPTHRENWHHIIQKLGAPQLQPYNLCPADSTITALSLAAAGYGIALARSPITDWMVKQFGLQDCAVSEGISSSESYYLVYQNLESLSPAGRLFRSWIIDETSG